MAAQLGSTGEYIPLLVLLSRFVDAIIAVSIVISTIMIKDTIAGSDTGRNALNSLETTGAVFVYAGQYQPAPARVLQEIEPHEYVSVVGKPRTYETDDGGTNVAIRPESITVIEEATRYQWVVETAEQTLERVRAFDQSTNEFAQMAREHYDRPLEGVREGTITALESLDEESPSPLLRRCEESRLTLRDRSSQEMTERRIVARHEC